MPLSFSEAKRIKQAIALLKSEIAALEARLQESSPGPRSGSARSIALRVLASAERVEDLVASANMD